MFQNDMFSGRIADKVLDIASHMAAKHGELRTAIFRTELDVHFLHHFVVSDTIMDFRVLPIIVASLFHRAIRLR